MISKDGPCQDANRIIVVVKVIRIVVKQYLPFRKGDALAN